jgi:hypothetical protein
MSESTCHRKWNNNESIRYTQPLLEASTNEEIRRKEE